MFLGVQILGAREREIDGERRRESPTMQALILKSFLLSSGLVKRREFSRASVAQLSLIIYLHLPQPGKRTRECGV